MYLILQYFWSCDIFGAKYQRDGDRGPRVEEHKHLILNMIYLGLFYDNGVIFQ